MKFLFWDLYLGGVTWRIPEFKQRPLKMGIKLPIQWFRSTQSFRSTHAQKTQITLRVRNHKAALFWGWNVLSWEPQTLSWSRDDADHFRMPNSKLLQYDNLLLYQNSMVHAVFGSCIVWVSGMLHTSFLEGINSSLFSNWRSHLVTLGAWWN